MFFCVVLNSSTPTLASPVQVADALLRLAEQIRTAYAPRHGDVRDDAGQIVGRWVVSGFDAVKDGSAESVTL